MRYSCNECMLSCCTDCNLIMNKREWLILSKAYSFFKYFVIGKNKSNIKKTFSIIVHPTNPICWFYKKNLCIIHRKYGYKEKPLVCKAHPYYIYRYGDVAIVSPLSRCKSSLAIVRDIRENKKTKDQMKLILKGARDLVRAGVFRGEIHWTKKRLDLERRIFQESKRYLKKENYLEFVIRQMQLTYPRTCLDSIEQTVNGKIELWKKFLKIEDINLNNRLIAYKLTAITSLLRFNQSTIHEGLGPLLLLALYFLSVVCETKAKTENDMLVNQYVDRTGPAKGLLCLMDDQQYKVKLLLYVGRGKNELSTFIKNNSIADLADKLKLTIEERMIFIQHPVSRMVK